MIQDYSDPKVTLSQIYAAATNGQSAVLGACVIGPNYKICSYGSNGQAARIQGQTAYSPTVGFSAAYPLRGSGDGAVDLNSVRVSARDAELIYQTLSDSYSFTLSSNILTIKKDGAAFYIAGTNNQLAIPVKAGDKVLVTIDSQVVQDTILALDGVQGSYNKVQLLSAAAGVVTKVQFMRTVDYAVLDADSVGATATLITVKANAKAIALLGAASALYPIHNAKFYAKYRSFNKTFVGKVLPIAATTDQQVADILGEVCQENPLALAVACATKAANSRFVYFTATEYDAQVADNVVDTRLTEAYQQAADLVADNDAVHGIVPCTANKDVLQKLLEVANVQSNEQIPHYKYLYASCNIPQISDSETMSASRANALRVNTLVQNKAVADKRASIVFADGALHNGISVDNFCVAAAVAGLRSASQPHAPLSNVVLPGIQVTEEHGFTNSQLKTLGANGFLRVGLNANGDTIIRRQLTSAAKDDVNYDQQSIICNIDSICLDLKNSGTELVGSSNISPALLGLLRTDLEARLRNYMYYVNEFIGPQLLSGQIQDIHQDSVHKDRVYATLNGEPPKPFNRFSITFRMI